MFGQEQQSISIQRTEGTANVPEPLVNYIDQKIAELDKKIKLWDNRKGHARELIDVEETQQEIANLQRMRNAMFQGEYIGIVSLLKAEQAQAEHELASLQRQLRPRSTDPMGSMAGDFIYFAMKDNVMHEQRILAKAAAVLDQDDTTYITGKIEKYRSEQRKTERGSVLSGMGVAQGHINSIGSLQKLIPLPAAKRS